MIYPKGIKKGDTIGIVAPSGPFRATTLGEIENALNDLGYNVKFGESCYGSYNPKFFVGFSDITVLHIAFNKYADLVTFHGVMAGTSPKWDEFTYNSLINALNNNVTKFENPNDEPIYTVVKGQCEGELIGGNLALIAAGIGTKYEIDTNYL